MSKTITVGREGILCIGGIEIGHCDASRTELSTWAPFSKGKLAGLNDGNESLAQSI